MSSERIDAVYLTTHNWGKSAKFFRAPGFTLAFETDHHSGQLRSGDGPFLFIAEVPPGMQVVLKVPNDQVVQPQPIVDVVTPFEDTHWGTRDMTVRDPDGRVWRLQAPGQQGA
ncbi:VOC family protein [Burkholderia sp. Ac-20344]|uniref:VOC family protein n=1 Tax=Burkholderia sp. Ac-20344 TaxID=2703890 RepID=UPI00197C23B1|nr:VOC family protein [Burkholderia sp. Ac-20344]MBN3834401.1 VOC family protein [Burkholderia sp. Ac-20344]